jgi:hemerythrin-like domain-containing protein
MGRQEDCQKSILNRLEAEHGKLKMLLQDIATVFNHFSKTALELKS